VISLKILINSKISQEHVEKIQSGFPAVEVVQTANPQEAEKIVWDADVIVSWWSNFQPAFLDSPKLRWVHALSAGVDGFLLPQIL